MELPDWVVDEVMVQLRPAALRLCVALYRHGRPAAGPQGQRRLYWRGSLQQAARLTGVSKRALIDATEELRDAGLLRRHEAEHAPRSRAMSVPLERWDRCETFSPCGPGPAREGPGGAETVGWTGEPFSPVGEAEAAGGGEGFALPGEPGHGPHGDGDPSFSTHPSINQGNTTTHDDPEVAARRTPERARELLREHFGVTNPEAWLAEFGFPAVSAALARYFEFVEETPGYVVRNPAGFLRKLLERGRAPVRMPSH